MEQDTITSQVKKAMSRIQETAGKSRPTPTGKLSWLRKNKSWMNKHLQVDCHCPKVEKMAAEAAWFCKSAYGDPANGNLLVLAGLQGTGKTHCARRVHRWINHVGPSKNFMSAPGQIGTLHSVFWQYGELLDTLKEGGWSIVDELKEVPVLVIDDLGAAHDPSKVGIDKVTQILGRREFKWTIVTTNVKPNDWQTEFDNRVSSRLARNSSIISLFDVDDYAALQRRKAQARRKVSKEIAIS